VWLYVLSRVPQNTNGTLQDPTVVAVTSYMRQVLALDYRVILLFLWPDIAYQTLTVMYNLGLFGGKYLFIFCEHMQTTDLMQDRTFLTIFVVFVVVGTPELQFFCDIACARASMCVCVCMS
jgi:hypothetical protein